MCYNGYSINEEPGLATASIAVPTCGGLSSGRWNGSAMLVVLCSRGWNSKPTGWLAGAI